VCWGIVGIIAEWWRAVDGGNHAGWWRVGVARGVGNGWPDPGAAGGGITRP